MLVLGLIALLCAGSSFGLSKEELLIDEINSVQSLWKAGLNWVPGTGPRLGGRRPPAVTLPEKEPSPRSARIPQSFDARKRWPQCPTISHIYDQGACGACWAVAASSTLADRVCIASNGSFTEQLSATQLMACCGKMCGDGCDGGDDYRAWVYFAKTGIVTGGDYQSNQGCQPYELEPCEHYQEGPRTGCKKLTPPSTPSCNHQCTNPLYTTSFEADLHKTKRSYKVMSDPEEIQKEIMEHGPVQAGITVYEDLTHYKSGVYKRVGGNKVGEHSVRILGWGWQRDTPYWLVANTWNSDWGDQGTFKIIRGQNEVGIEEAVHAGIPLV